MIITFNRAHWIHLTKYKSYTFLNYNDTTFSLKFHTSVGYLNTERPQNS